MRLLIFTSLFPDKDEKANGCFVYRRIVELQKKSDIEVSLLKLNNIIKSKKIKRRFKLSRIGYDSDFKFRYLNVISYQRKFYYLFEFILVKFLIKFVQRNNIDLIHVHFVTDAYLIYKVYLKIKIPYIITAHGDDIHRFPYEKNFNVTKYLEILENAHSVIFVSKVLMNKAKEFGYSSNNAVIIPNGINLNIFYPDVKKNNQIKQVGFIGSFLPVKRADIIPDIFFKIYQRYKNVEFIMIGEGSLESIIKRKINEYSLDNIVKFTGQILPDEVAEYLREIDVLILPSLNEGYGCVILEAHATGVPVVASTAGGIPEAIGDEGIMVEEGDEFIDRFSEAVVSLLYKPIDKKKLYLRASQFDWCKIVEREIEVYRQIV